MVETTDTLALMFRPKTAGGGRCGRRLTMTRLLMHSVVTLWCLFSVAMCSPTGQVQGQIASRRTTYPSVMFCIVVRDKAHTIPYFLGNVEELDYPKDRIHWFIRVDNGSDESAQMLQSWIEAVRSFYGTVDFDVFDGSALSHTATGESQSPSEQSRRQQLATGWRQDAMFLARSLSIDYLFFVNCDVFLINPKTLQQLIAEKVTVVTPMLHSVSRYSNFWESVATNGSYVRSEFYESLYKRQRKGLFKVPVVSSAIFVNLGQLQSNRLNFQVISTNYSGFQEDVTVLVVEKGPSAPPSGGPAPKPLELHVLNKEVYGYLIPPAVNTETLAESLENMRYLALESMTNTTFTLLHSPFFNDVFPPPDKLGFNQVYLINLKRRADRRRRMLACFRLLGIDAEIIDATDGNKLTIEDLEKLDIHQLKDYKDPYHKRPMTMGEIGCFLSHYHIWQDVVEHKYDRVVVFEDDIRFVYNFRRRLQAVVNELERNEIYWDLVYLGRKRLSLKEEGPMVPNCNHVSYVGYTYWTLGYILTLRGARKLLEAEPLQRLVPVDEYLPIMYDRHPEHQWKEAFPSRNLKAFTAEPLLVYPTHYVGEKGYISDTENAKTVDPTKLSSSSSQSEASATTYSSSATAKDEL